MWNMDINLIVREVIGRMTRQKEKTLLVFTGAMTDFELAFLQLKKLRSEGFSFDLLFSESAEKILDLKLIEQELSPDRIIDINKIESNEQLILEYERVLVGTFSANTCGKLANCITDTPVTRILMEALMLGKNVTIIKNGACPQCIGKANASFRINKGLKAALVENLKKVQGFGAQIVSAEELTDLFIKSEKKNPGPGENRKKRIINAAEIEKYEKGSTVTVSKNVIITALAIDIARQKQINLIYE